MKPPNHTKDEAFLKQVELNNVSVLKQTGIDAVELQLQQLEVAHNYERKSSRKSTNRGHHTTETKKEKKNSNLKKEEKSISDEDLSES